ncbi:probable inactive receptor kinase At4g23740 [Amaranthus tricolor]|uniref:probable inactive receptor kinase At4g23740 n=1 Tax=Amaranthus tricolor TaxID=29722 RepID=UPI00258F29D6|nr:probable inactive receptor kinase At4g23740 [Amaranthus tricolor]XP_057521163.1 probable inactive receptor kinase At4g23740 [Amaranthus tricolor]XP_057521164.1 probable inactive receptor kinase At4g23740 [Amaranthus tricolor]
MRFPSSFSIVLMVFVYGFLCNADLLEDDKKALLDFVNKAPHFHALNWSENSSICSNWTGITCNADFTRVIGVRLPGVGFNGEIPGNTISRLSALQILSLRSNRISGTFPLELSNLKNLTMLFLQFNDFSGPLPSEFSNWGNLSVLNLSNNRFNGSIPKSISSLIHLSALNLANNLISGEIPDLGLSSLQVLNVSNNNLTGFIPKSLQRFPRSSFVGNDVGLVNSSVEQSDVAPLIREEPTKTRNLSRQGWFLAIVIGFSVLGIGAFGFLFVACLRKRNVDDGFTGKFPKGRMSPEKTVSGSQDSRNRLVFFEGCSYAFDLEDLLRASAEVLGKGTFGMSYKAILEDANVVVVKRLKEVSAGKREFEQQMDLIGSIRHGNVVALRAFYYSKDEKLMVNDYCCQGSISAMLHSQRGEDRIALDWETRLRIAIGAARGIAHLHTVNSGKFVHGNIRSSNIFLNSKKFGCVSDFGLASVMSPLAPPISRAAGFRAPEVTDTRKATQPSDVYSFGVFLLELLTGKSPVHATGGDELVHLVRWVHSVVREEWTAEVFDLELLRYPHVEEEMVEMLQIALSCVARVPDQRPRMSDLLKMIEEVRHVPAEVHTETESSTMTPQ